MVFTEGTYSVRDCEVYIEAVQMPSASEEAWAALVVRHDNENLIEMRVEGGIIIASVRTDGEPSPTDVSIPYAPDAHRWWRIKEERLSLRLETSPDGTRWTVLGAFFTPGYVDSVRVGLTSGRPTSNTASDPVRFDNFNTHP